MFAHAHNADDTQPLICGRFVILDILSGLNENPIYLLSDESQRKSLRSLQILTAARIFAELPPRIRKYLQGELTLSKEIRHPNIVSVYELVEGDGACVFNMEYVPGLSIENCRDKLLLSSYHVLNVAIQLYSTLAFLHAKALSHGHLDSANVMIRNDGTVKILFWGTRIPANQEKTLDCQVASRLCLDLLATQASLLEGVDGRTLRGQLTEVLETFAEEDKDGYAATCYQTLMSLQQRCLPQDPESLVSGQSLDSIIIHSSRIRASQSITAVLILWCIVSAFLVILAIFGERLCIALG